MAEPHETPRDDQLEAFLDGLLSDAERAAFVAKLRDDPARRRQVELQAQIDGALGRLFHVEAPSHEQIAAALAGAVHNGANVELGRSDRLSAPRVAAASGNVGASRNRGSRTYWAAISMAAAAAVGWVIVTLLGSSSKRDTPDFVARPVAEIYQQAVASGFEPTYDCREPERFAATFSQRQGQPLHLLAMPGTMKMMGLAYVGGLSRQTTAVLCRVDGEPVMVFVDRAGVDRADAGKTTNPKLRVFRDEKDGLVFYEVTPLDRPRITPLLTPPAAAERGASSPAA